MIVLKILIGLVGLGFVVLVHEFGHLVAAKLVGIEVEAFSIGWGKKLAGYTWRGTEYRISVFPVGGFCKMKGERSYAQAIDEGSTEIPHEPGSYFAAHPWRRIVALLAGPIANFVLAVIILSIVWLVGFRTESTPNRIILASEYGVEDVSEINPADAAGLQSGDTIVSLGGEEIVSYRDIQLVVSRNALTPLDLTVLRDGTAYSLSITPALDSESGAGYVGVYPWVDPVVSEVTGDSPAYIAGVQPGDVLVAIEGEPVEHTIDIAFALQDVEFPVQLDVMRSGSTLSLSAPAPLEDEAIDGIVLGIAFQTITIASPDLNVFEAVGRGATESFTTLTDSVRSLRLLFKGVRVTSAVAGPGRIAFYIGDIATSAFAFGFGTGVLEVARFLALISVILFFMNLLPIPILDGGQIVLAAAEWIKGRGPRPKFIYRYQLVGSAIVLGILFVAIFGDILFAAGR